MKNLILPAIWNCGFPSLRSNPICKHAPEIALRGFILPIQLNQQLEMKQRIDKNFGFNPSFGHTIDK